MVFCRARPGSPTSRVLTCQTRRRIGAAAVGEQTHPARLVTATRTPALPAVRREPLRFLVCTRLRRELWRPSPSDCTHSPVNQSPSPRHATASGRRAYQPTSYRTPFRPPWLASVLQIAAFRVRPFSHCASDDKWTGNAGPAAVLFVDVPGPDRASRHHGGGGRPPGVHQCSRGESS